MPPLSKTISEPTKITVVGPYSPSCVDRQRG
jgi:hypothetical protein